MADFDTRFKSNTVEWATPPEVYDPLNREFGFTLDVAATPENAKCPRYYTRNDDGLAQPWDGVCWMNPPYGKDVPKFGRHGVELCGTMFGLRIYRHRIFETNFQLPLPPAPCDHSRHAMNPHRAEGRARIYAEHGRQDPEKLWAAEMGVEWMSRHGAREAVPPCFTEWIGRELAKTARRQNVKDQAQPEDHNQPSKT